MRRDGISAQDLRKLRRMALRLARTAEDADDLVQDTLLAALEQKRACDGARFFAWAAGLLRRRSAFLARTAGRRRRRDTGYAVEAAPAPTPERKLPQPFIEALPPSLQTIAHLANAGLGRAEISVLLGISDVALRQRISCLRKAWMRSGAEPDMPEPLPRHRPPCGLLRRSLKANLVRLPAGRSALVDPDGHEIFLSAAHDSPARGN